MISPISFSGTYKVNSQNPNSFSKFYNYALDKEYEDGVRTILKEDIVERENNGGFCCKVEQTLIVPDYMDLGVENFCANNGIKNKKHSTISLLRPNSIKSRIASAPEGYKKVNVDVKKLEELAKNQASNFEHCRGDYKKYYSDKVVTMLRSGDEIPATTLTIRNHSGNDNLKRYVNYFGVKNLNDKQIVLGFKQKTDDPDHCLYFALKDIGLKKIPVYVDDESYFAGRVLGLF